MPENIRAYQERLVDFRNQLEILGLDGFILPRTDEYQGEFLAAYAQRLSWLTGFTGSAGAAIVLKDKAVVLSDGRYTIQLKNEVRSDLYMLGNSVETSVQDWILQHADEGARIGFDPWLHTPRQILQMRKALVMERITLVAVERNPVDVIWRDQPQRPSSMVEIFPQEVAGKSFAQKRDEILEDLRKAGGDALILSAPDSICWLMNVRGNDVEYTPLVLSYLLLHANGEADWFIDMGKVSDAVLATLGDGVRINAYSHMEQCLARLDGKRVRLDFATVPSGFEGWLKGCELVDFKDPCAHPRSIKSAAEQVAIREVHIRDARALAKFLSWFEAEVPKGNLTEMSVSDKLEEFRSADPAYRGQSFPTICGFAENGAIIHYRSAPATNKKIVGDGLLLIDSGGQYEWGTTDITRTIAVGTPSLEMRENYTRVLKGHIAVSMAVFPQGTTGAQVDVWARTALWQVGLDYAHGTGHGVGCYLGVHEAAASISPRSTAAIEAGMLLSNEPGYYKEGAYGIRIENLVLAREVGECKETGKVMLGFETVTYAPYDARLIVDEMLTREERDWLARYEADLAIIIT